MRYTGISLVKEALMRDGRIEAYDAVYRLTDPDGHPHRLTRLAVTIHTLRRRGWDIETVEEPGKLAVYVLRATPETPVLRCPVCDAPLSEMRQTIAMGWYLGYCPTDGWSTVHA